MGKTHSAEARTTWREKDTLRNEKACVVGADRARADVHKTAERQEGATALGPFNFLSWSSGEPEMPPPAALPACGGPGAEVQEKVGDALADEGGAHRHDRCSGGFGDDRWGCWGGGCQKY